MRADGRGGRLGVGVIGMGHVGPAIASALRSVGHLIVGVNASSDAALERVLVMLPGVPVLDVPTLVERSEVVVLAVPDDQIGPLVAGLAKLRVWRAGQLVIHLSGAHGIAILEPAREYGAIPLALHPAMTFTGTSMDVARLAGTPFAVTAPPLALPIAQALVMEMGGEPVEIAEADRTLYHCALTHGANFLAVQVLQSLSMLRAASVEDPSALVRPLFTAALDRALREGHAAVSGPVPRGDAGTIKGHVAALEEVASDVEPDTLATYVSMTRATVAMLHATGRLSTASTKEILAALR